MGPCFCSSLRFYTSYRCLYPPVPIFLGMAGSREPVIKACGQTTLLIHRKQMEDLLCIMQENKASAGHFSLCEIMEHSFVI